MQFTKASRTMLDSMVAVCNVFYSRFWWECHGNLLVYMMMSFSLCMFEEVILKSHLLSYILIVFSLAKTKCFVFFSSIFTSIFEDDSIIFLSWRVAIVSPNDRSLHLKSWRIILLACCQNVSADILFNIFALLFISESCSVIRDLCQAWVSKFVPALCKKKSGLVLNNGAV